mgnify:CR=1 FL=1
MKKNLFRLFTAMTLLAGAVMTSSCGTDGYDADVTDSEAAKNAYDSAMATDASEGDIAPGGGKENGNSMAGIVTAGEWNDLIHWPFWSKLMLGEEFSKMSDYWQFFTNNRLAVSVTDTSGKPLAGISVKLQRQSIDIWETVTDNHGEASCWVGFCQHETAAASALRITIDGKLMENAPVLCPFDSLQGGESVLEKVSDKYVNHYAIATSKAPRQQADIAFIVDATGSMADEINFLKNDLEDIITKTASVRPGMKMRTAALFYRDEGDDYLTRHSDFTEKLENTKDFVSKQNAGGGGDYPEAVHSALEKMLQNLSWDSDARTRMAFLILDAPAHHQTDVIASLQKSVTQCARQGIRLIPVAASGVDKNTEFMLRFFAVATGGTYVFLTNDSGVGFDHIAASVGPYEVEQLNSLIVRLISYYTE